jgi:CheY-like chemotaxis protein
VPTGIVTLRRRRYQEHNVASSGEDSTVNQYQSTIDATHGLAHSCVMKLRKTRSATERSLVSVVDDDESVRESLPDLLREFGFAARAFSSAEEFLSSDSVGQTRCLILDIAMPGMTGLDLQRELKLRGQKIPIIFITARRDEAVRARAFEQGAVEFLLKPFSDTALLEGLNAALRVS